MKILDASKGPGPGLKVCAFLSGLTMLALLAVLLAGSGAGSARTLHVDDDAPPGGDGSQGSPFQEIQDAVDASENGDTIRVLAGNYSGAQLNKTLSLEGSHGEPSTIHGVVTISSNWTNMSDFSTTSVLQVMYADYVTIFNNHCSGGISLEGASYTLVANNTCNGGRGRTEGIFTVPGGWGGKTGHSNVITNNSCSGYTGGIGILVANSVNDIISYNRCYLNERGIMISGGSNITLIGNNCSQNGIGEDAVLWGGISLYYGSQNCSLIGNNCSLNSNSGIMVGISSSITLLENICSFNSLNGISLFHSNSSELTGNILTGNHDGGMAIDGENVVVTGNSFFSNWEAGLYLRGYGISLTANTFIGDGVTPPPSGSAEGTAGHT